MPKNLSRSSRARLVYKPLASKQGRCTYCGERANTRDHVVPLAVTAALQEVECSITNKAIVLACAECNNLANSTIFFSKMEKRKYIQKQLRKRYEHVLNIPDWSEEEIAELRPNMQKDIKAALALKKRVLRRINFGAN